MLDRLVSQTLIDGLAAVAIGASVFMFARTEAAGPLRLRLVFAFGGLCLFFGARAASSAFDSELLSLLSELVSCALPLAALVLAEGLLRRHAPTPLKAIVCGAAVAVAIALLATGGQPPASNWALGGYVVLSLAGVTALLLARDRSSLSRQENASVKALVISGAALTVLSATDFLPGAPVGLSGVGAAMVAYALSANPSSGREVRLALGNLFVVCILAAAIVAPFAAALGLANFAGQARLGAILVAALLAVGAVLDARRRTSRSTRAFAHGLAHSDTSSLDAFLGSLAEQPLLAGLRLAEDGLLADYDQQALGAAMAAGAVWTPPAVRGAQIAARAREELSDLMARTEATHALLISPEPLRIALLTLPVAGSMDDVAADLALFQKLAALAAERPR